MSKFSNIDAKSSKLIRVFGKKGGAQGRRIKNIMIPKAQTNTIDVKREFTLKVYLNEEPENLLKEDTV